MPDITMCRADCPSSAKCRRHPDSGTVPSEFQWWAGFAPETDRCGDFWAVKEAPNRAGIVAETEARIVAWLRAEIDPEWTPDCDAELIMYLATAIEAGEHKEPTASLRAREENTHG